MEKKVKLKKTEPNKNMTIWKKKKIAAGKLTFPPVCLYSFIFC